jgi:hypothetical protein
MTMGCWKTCTCLVCLLGLASAQTAPQAFVGPMPPAWTNPVGNRTKIEPIVLSRASLDEKVITLRLAPRIATSIRLPEPINSVVLGDPEAFQAEHSEHEPELVTVKPVATMPAQTNLLITTTLGHQVNLLLTSGGDQNEGPQAVDLLLKYGKSPGGGTFLVEDNATSSSFVAETQSLDGHHKDQEAKPPAPGPSLSASLITPASFDSSKGAEEKSGEVLDKLLDRQRQAALPALYGQHAGEVEAGPRVKAGVSEVLDEGREVVVLFSVVNPANHAIEILPPQVQLGGKVKKKWTTAEQLHVIDFRLTSRRIGAGQRADGVVVFERPGFKQSNETLFLQIADSGAVDLPALAPIGFGISSFRGGSAHESK